MAKLAGEELREIPYYGLMECKVGGADCVISQTGFTGGGYEIYEQMRKNAEKMWNAVLEERRVWFNGVTSLIIAELLLVFVLGQDLDHETSPFQVNLNTMPLNKKTDYIAERT